MLRWLAPSILAVSASLACGSGRLLDDISSSTTRLRLEPASFRGNVPCSKGAEGALQSYVVRFQEDGAGPDAGLQRMTSSAVPCDRASLIDALAGRYYVADIYGFDTISTDPNPPLDSARWTASCGRGDGTGTPDAGLGGPTLALYGFIVPMGGCTTFSGQGGSDGTGLVIDQESALGDLSCGIGPGLVSRLEGLVDGTRVSAACGQPLVFELPALPRHYDIELTAYEASPSSTPPAMPSTPPPASGPDLLDASAPDAAGADAAADVGGALDAGVAPGGPAADAGGLDAGVDPGVARWRTLCFGRTLPGVISDATCDPLIPIP